jgi:asparagine N-glycosylation enzyme membrane subunit Stt3
VRSWRVANPCARPLKLIVREQRYVRLASALFIVLIALNVLFTPFHTLNAVRVFNLLVYVVLAYFLWRRNRIAAVVGGIVAVLGVLILGYGTYLLWQFVSDQTRSLGGTWRVSATMIVPLLINLLISVVLITTLLANNRWRGP